METLIASIILIAFLALFIGYAAKANAGRKKQAAEVAGMLGLNFIDQGQEFKELLDKSGTRQPQRSPDSSLRASAEQLEQYKRLMQMPLMKRILDMSSPWQLAGTFNNVAVEIRPVTHGSGKSKQHFIRFSAAFEPKLPFEFAISREGMFAKMGKGLGVVHEIEIGNQALDRLLLIKGSDSGAIRDWLCHSLRQQALESLFRACPEASITQEGVEFERRGREIDLNIYRETLDALTQAVRELEMT